MAIAGGRRNPEERIRVPVLAVLVPEVGNPYDPNSVAIWVNGLQVGNLSRDNSRRYRPQLLALQRKYGSLSRSAMSSSAAGCVWMAQASLCFSQPLPGRFRLEPHRSRCPSCACEPGCRSLRC